MTAAKSLRSSASSDPAFADEALRSGETALDSTRELASRTLEKAGDRMRDLRDGARDLAGRGLSTIGDTAAAAQERFGRYAGATSRYVTEQPIRSALIAAAVGAIAAGLIVAARRRSR